MTENLKKAKQEIDRIIDKYKLSAVLVLVDDERTLIHNRISFSDLFPPSLAEFTKPEIYARLSQIPEPQRLQFWQRMLDDNLCIYDQLHEFLKYSISIIRECSLQVDYDRV